jgi:hypothetical protein
MTTYLRSFRFVLIAAGLTVAAPAFASALTPLCGDEKGSQDEKNNDKNKSDTNKKDNQAPKKPTNPS